MAKRRRSESLGTANWSDYERENATTSNNSESDGASFELKSRHFSSKKKNKVPSRKKVKRNASVPRIEDERGYTDVPLHSKSTHAISVPQAVRSALLSWYRSVRNIRGMPWRRPYDPNLGPEERAQRAYEVWISEIMLQQTQVATVIPYYNRWMQRFPTIRDLAGGSIDEVNNLWKGLGYYSRARRLLEGAHKAVQDYNGKLPGNAKDMEANIPGIGRYSAGAICSIAYGERVPVLDGNVHRLLSRFLALHAPPKAKATLDLLWTAAQTMVELDGISPNSNSRDQDSDSPKPQHPGDINQALIELGSTVCKPRNPDCHECPLRTWCSAYQQSEGARDRPLATLIDIEDACHLCEPMPGPVEVTSYPMKVDRKKAREELDIVHVIEWHSKNNPDDRHFLMTRRPENGLLAGLYDFPTSAAVSPTTTRNNQESLSSEILSKLLSKKEFSPTSCSSHEPQNEELEMAIVSKIQYVGDVLHAFSHIRKTYRVQWVVLEGGTKAPELRKSRIGAESQKKAKKGKNMVKSRIEEQDANMWVAFEKVLETNMGTGVVKVWNLMKNFWAESGVR